MPVLFTGHRPPLKYIQSNEFTDYQCLRRTKIPKPTAVLCISAHWLSRRNKLRLCQIREKITISEVRKSIIRCTILCGSRRSHDSRMRAWAWARPGKWNQLHI